MQLKKRKTNGIWFVEFMDRGSRRRVSTGETDRTKAHEVAQKLLAGKSKNRVIVRLTLGAALWDTYERIWSAAKSADRMRYMVSSLARSSIGYLEVEDVTYPRLVQFVTDCQAEGLAAATINRKLAAISKALGECVKKGELAQVPPMPHQRENNARDRWLTREEERALLNACSILVETDAIAMRALLVFLVDTGARLGEALKFGRHINRPKLATFKDTKNGTSRSVPLTDRAQDAATRLPDWNKDRCERLFRRVRAEAGVPDVVMHTLRHTCLSHLVQGGMDLYRVQRWAGHSDIRVTQRYAHLAPSSLDEGTTILAENTRPNLRSVK